MKHYLLDVTFCSGGDEPRDVDHGLFLMTSSRKYSKEELLNTFCCVNAFLAGVDEDEVDVFPVSYEEDGLNINTLIEGVRFYTKKDIVPLTENCGRININDYYVIEQWW